MLSQTHLKQWQIALIVAGALAVTSIVLISPDPFFWLAGLALGERNGRFAQGGMTTPHKMLVLIEI